MIVPAHWAESRLQHRDGRRQITVRRFGWSDLSAEAAQAHADERAQEALARLVAGEKLARREPKVSYNGASGMPIREEIVARHGDTVITRNAYGALCMNTPDVLFVDVDFARRPPLRWAFASFALLVFAGAALLAARLSTTTMLPVIAVALLLAAPMAMTCPLPAVPIDRK